MMTDELTPRLALPLLHAAQAQKEFTHNEALLRLDALVCGTLAGGPLTQPPPDASPGSVWLVGAGATGDWAGEDERLAIASPSGWRFVEAPAGLTLARLADGAPVVRTVNGWRIGTLVADRLEVGRRRIGGATAGTVADPVGGATIDQEVRSTLTTLLSILRAQGLVGASGA